METAGNVLLRSIKVSRHLKIQGFKQPDAHPGVISLTCSQAKGLSQTFKRAKIRRQQQFYFIDGPWIPLRLLATDLLGTSRSECFENCTSRGLNQSLLICTISVLGTAVSGKQSVDICCIRVSVSMTRGTMGHVAATSVIVLHFLPVPCWKPIIHPGISSAAQGTPERPPSMLARNINKPDLNIYIYIII